MLFDTVQRPILNDLRLLFNCPAPSELRRDQVKFVDTTREKLRRAVQIHFAYLGDQFANYDQACVEFSALAKPKNFISFFNQAPKLVHKTGEHLASLMHYAELVRFRLMRSTQTLEANAFYDLHKDLSLGMLDPDDEDLGYRLAS